MRVMKHSERELIDLGVAKPKKAEAKKSGSDKAKPQGEAKGGAK